MHFTFHALRSLIDGGCGIVGVTIKYQKLIVGRRGELEKTESFNSGGRGGRGGLAFKLLFSFPF